MEELLGLEEIAKGYLGFAKIRLHLTNRIKQTSL
jgi:hypothetical protein